MTTWRPKEPVVVPGPYTLSAQEAWLRFFTDEWFRLADGNADLESVADWAIKLYPTHNERDPVEVARAEWVGAS